MFESIAAFWAEYGNVLTDGVWDTLVMVVISTAFAYLIGLPLGVALILTQPHGIRPHRGVYRVLDWIVNIGRSVPFIILMVAIMPFTRMVVGTTIGVKGAIPPLVVSAAPFIARMVETSLAEVDAGVVEAVAPPPQAAAPSRPRPVPISRRRTRASSPAATSASAPGIGADAAKTAAASPAQARRRNTLWENSPACCWPATTTIH